MEWLSGKKTYIVMIGVIVSAVVAFTTGEATLSEAIATALTGLGLGTLRAGVSKGAV